jgi:uncharacterized membrane protein YfcA
MNVIEDVSSGKLNYTLPRCLTLSLLGFIIGLGAVFFGLSGGAIINPLLILIGFDPLVMIN